MVSIRYFETFEKNYCVGMKDNITMYTTSQKKMYSRHIIYTANEKKNGVKQL